LKLCNSPYRIFLISDDLVEIALFKSDLESKDFTVFVSNISNFNVFRDFNPEVIILYSMSLVEVIETCQEIRLSSNIPILVLSTVGEPGIIEKTLNAGADEYLTKPVSENILIAHLNTLSRRSREEKDAKNHVFQDSTLEDPRSQLI